MTVLSAGAAAHLGTGIYHDLPEPHALDRAEALETQLARLRDKVENVEKSEYNIDALANILDDLTGGGHTYPLEAPGTVPGIEASLNRPRGARRWKTP